MLDDSSLEYHNLLHEPEAECESESKSKSKIKYIPLGDTDIQISPLGIGTWSWGDRMIWGYGQSFTHEDIHRAFLYCVNQGITFFDTAETYGWGLAEKLLGHFIAQSQVEVVVASKFLPSPWRLRKVSVLHALEKSLERLNGVPLTLYQFHKPYPPISIETWMEALVEATEFYNIPAIGIANCTLSQMEQAMDALAAQGHSLASIQIEMSLLCHTPEIDDLLKTCHSKTITLFAYSPLGMGLLTGKYSPEHPPRNRFDLREKIALHALSLAIPGYFAAKGCQFGSDEIRQIQPLVDLLVSIGQSHGGKTPAQVALNWVISQGAVPIVGVKNYHQARDNSGAVGWTLTGEELTALHDMSARLDDLF
ncbi:MAG: aldo/keto reductase [Theionarchaea archaeon]|nr:aldo/keto reductase [Theionarchaea archaeon]